MTNTPAQLDNNIDIAKELYKRNIELFKERRRTEELLYRVSEAIYAADEKCTITLFNHTLSKMLNINTEDALGKNVSEIVKLIDNDEEEIDVTDFCKKDQDLSEYPKSAILIAPNKNYYVHVKVSLIDTKTEGIEYLVTMSDVTQEKELENEKDEFISITSHELKTPMSIIKSYIWMLQSGRGGDLNEKQRKYIDKAMKGTDRMINLINDMLKISRMEQGKLEFKFEYIGLATIIKETLEEFELLINEKELYLNLDLDDSVSKVYSDKGKVVEILMNLVSNATKYTDKGGITIKLENAGNDFVRLSVHDTGRGISTEESDRLFKKFQRLDNSYETMAKAGGTGLGLYIIKMYMSNLGGSIGVESEGLGKGSMFWITLPTKSHLTKEKGLHSRL